MYQQSLTSKAEKEQLLAKLDTTKHMSRAKDQQISMLEEQLKVKQMIAQQKSKYIIMAPVLYCNYYNYYYYNYCNCYNYTCYEITYSFVVDNLFCGTPLAST